MAYKGGDMVWAKMKGFPPWPGYICSNPPQSIKKPSMANKKVFHCIYFYGSKNYAWIAEDSISEYAKNKEVNGVLTGKKHMPAALKEAIIEADKLYKDFLLADKKGEIDITDFTSYAKNVSLPSIEEELNTIFNNKVIVPNGDHAETNGFSSDSSKDNLSYSNGSETSKRKLIKTGSFSKKTKKEQNTTNNIDTKSLKFSERYFKKPTTNELNFNFPPMSNVNHPTPTTIIKDSIPNDTLSLVKPKSIESRTLIIGVVGAGGHIGTQLTNTFLNAGRQVKIWNRTQSKCHDLVKAGATSIDTIANIIECCDLIFFCLSDHIVLRKLLLTDDVIRNLCQGKIILNCTVSTERVSTDLSEVINSHQAVYMEVQLIPTSTNHQNKMITNQHIGFPTPQSPIKAAVLSSSASSSNISSDSNTHIVLVSGGDNHENYAKVESTLTLLGQTVYLGKVTPSAIKLSLLLKGMQAILVAQTAETLSLAERCGINLGDFTSILQMSQMDCPLIRQVGRDITEGIFLPNLALLQHQQKDVKLLLDMADLTNQPSPLLATTNEVFKRAKNLGYGLSDVSAVHKAYYL